MSDRTARACCRAPPLCSSCLCLHTALFPISDSSWKKSDFEKMYYRGHPATSVWRGGVRLDSRFHLKTGPAIIDIERIELRMGY